MLAIYNATEPVVFKAPNPSSNAERVPQGTKPGAKSGHKKHSTSSKQPFVSSKEAIKDGSSKAPIGSKTSHLKRKKESSSAMDSNLSQTLASTPVDAEIHKKDQQATSGPTSLGVTSEARANPQLSSGNDASAVSTAEADRGKSAPSIDPYVLADQTKSVSEGLETVLTQPKTGKGASFIARKVEEEEASNTIKLENLAKLVSNVKPSFKDLDSLKDDPIIVVDDSDEDEEDENKAEAEAALLKARPSFPNMGQLNELLLKSLQTEFSKILYAHNFSSLLPTKLKVFPSKFNERTEEELPPKFLSLPIQVASVQAKLKTLDALPGGAYQERQGKKGNVFKFDDETHVTGSMVDSSRIKKLKKFDFITEDGRHIYLSKEEINQQKKLEEDAKAEAAKQEREVRKLELVDLLDPEVVNKYYNDKLQYDKYYDKMLNKRAESRITNCDVLNKKGLITHKVYRKDGTSEVIPNFKASDLHLELGINLDIPLCEQDPLKKLNDLANKKRKCSDDIHDYFKANKRLKSSVQYEDHLTGTVLDEPVLGMIMFNSYHRQDFVTIEDLKDFLNTMLYTVHEIFFRCHQGLRLDDHARTFSSILLAGIDKRCPNLIK
nr:hypothetical protein [Tanacetum cinerariifolium]